jgi:hypothetical protein
MTAALGLLGFPLLVWSSGARALHLEVNRTSAFLGVSLSSGNAVLRSVRVTRGSGLWFRHYRHLCPYHMLVGFLEQMFLHLLHTLRIIFRNVKWLYFFVVLFFTSFTEE